MASSPLQRHPCLLLWEARNPRPRVGTAWVEGIPFPSERVATVSLVSAAPTAPRPSTIPLISRASAFARCAELLDYCSNSPTSPTRRRIERSGNGTPSSFTGGCDKTSWKSSRRYDKHNLSLPQGGYFFLASASRWEDPFAGDGTRGR